MKLKIFYMLFLVLFGLNMSCSPAVIPGSPSVSPSAPGLSMPSLAPPKQPANPEIILATTTSTQDSGLLDVLVAVFRKKTGYGVKAIAVGTGQALALGQRGEADVLLVHAPESELKFMDSGAGINRRLVMHNDFVIVGPPEDPAGIRGESSVLKTLGKIYQAKALFLSRGDESGTHQLEKSLWKNAGLEPSTLGGTVWYQQSGQGMGATLSIASEKDAYTISDRATYLALMRSIRLQILVEGNSSLQNIYHVIQVNPDKFSRVNAEGGKAFADFMVSTEAQEYIEKFGIDKYGQPLFFPDAGKPE